MALKVNINTSYKLSTSWVRLLVRVCVHKKNKPLVRRRESLLILRLVAMISRCPSVSSSVHAAPDIFRSLHVHIENAAD